jgi:putative ABC transport system permease protein
MLADLRYALRQLRKSPVFASVAILTLGLSIGINTAAFTWVRTMLFVRLPVEAPERLVFVWSVSPTRGINRTATSAADYIDWRAATTAFEDLAAAAPGSYNLAGAGAPVRVSAMRATPSFFRVLGIAASAGRPFQQDDGPRIAVLSHQLWTTRFGRDAASVGRAITLDGEAYTVVGVASEAASILRVDLWTPLMLESGAGLEGPRSMDRGRRDMLVIGRLKAGRTVDDARAELTGIAARLERDYPDTNAGWSVGVVPLLDTLVGSDTKVFLAVFTGAVLFVLLIGCANIANLLLARGLARTQEVAVRMALGAGRGRLVRQFLIESLVLAALGGGLGVLVAVWVNDLLRGTALGTIPFVDRVRIDASVLLFTTAVSLAAALAFGIAPAFQNSALRLQDALKTSGGTSVRRRSAMLRQVFVGGEVALATALLIVSGVFIRTGVAVLRANPGFDARNVLTARVSLPESLYARPDRASAFYQQALERLSTHAGILDAAATSRLPLAGGAANPTRSVEIEGRPAAERDQPWAIDLVVTQAYFRTLGIPIVAGRVFSERDSDGAPPVAIVSETFASRYLKTAGHNDALGRRIRLGSAASSWIEILGIAADVRNDDLGAPPAPQLYLPHAQNPAREMSLVVRTAAQPMLMQAELERVVRALDPALPVYQVRTMEQVVAGDMADVPVIIGIFTVCSGLALLLASMGIYGVVAYSVRQQTREIAIRLALGAKAREVVALVVRRASIWAFAGLAVGLAAALAVSRVVAHAVDFVEGVDPATLGATVAGLMLITLAASYLPARYATRVDPITALRAE